MQWPAERFLLFVAISRQTHDSPSQPINGRTIGQRIKQSAHLYVLSGLLKCETILPLPHTPLWLAAFLPFAVFWNSWLGTNCTLYSVCLSACVNLHIYLFLRQYNICEVCSCFPSSWIVNQYLHINFLHKFLKFWGKYVGSLEVGGQYCKGPLKSRVTVCGTDLSGSSQDPILGYLERDEETRGSAEGQRISWRN